MVGIASALAIAFSSAADAGPRLGVKPHGHAAKISAKLNARTYKFGGRFSSRSTEAEHISKEPFGAIPEGPLQVIISINQQQLHLYSDGVRVADTAVATGVLEHPTPLGVFSVIEKERYHESNIYSRAPMPYMQRITWSGVAMHQGNGAGHRASHGCIRLPEAFAARLWVLRSLGARVVIARPELTLEEFADPHLFVHKEPPPPAPTAAVEPVRTAQTIDSGRTSDAVAAAVPGASVDGAAKNLDSAEAVKPLVADKPVVADLRPATDGKDMAADATPSAGADPPAAAADPKPATAASDVPSVDASAVAVAAAAVNEPDPSAANREAEPAPRALPASLQTAKPAESPTDAAAKPAIDATLEMVPVPLPKPADLVRGAIGAPITIFVSRKASRIYVRQHFAPLFDAPIVIDRPAQPLGTHVFTAMEYLQDGATFRWNVISLPGEPPKTARNEREPQTWGRQTRGKQEWGKQTWGKQTRGEQTWGKRKRQDDSNAELLDLQPPQTPQEALARIEIPQAVIDRISELMVAGSSLIVSDQSLGEETGEGTDFIVVTR